MTRVLHIVDRHTPLDLVHQLNLLRREGQDVVSHGRPPWPGILWARPRVVHVAMGMVHLTAQRIRKRLCRPDVLHCWSIRSLGPASAMAGLFRSGLVLSLARVPRQRRHVEEIGKVFLGAPLRITVPTEAARRALAEKLMSLTKLPGGASCEGVFERIDILRPPARALLDAHAKAEARRRLGIAPGHFVLAAPGEALREARHERIAWAQGILSRLDLPVHLLLCDPGRYLALTLGRKQMTGATYPPRQVTDLGRNETIAAADLVVFAQACDVGCQAFAAALGCGAASLCAPTADAVETFGPDGDASTYLQSAHPRDLAHAVLRFIDRPESLQPLGVGASKRFAGRHSLAATKGSLEILYRKALEPSGLARASQGRL
jgi:glycosyltransferase involved in cell wall biosynthesis